MFIGLGNRVAGTSAFPNRVWERGLMTEFGNEGLMTEFGNEGLMTEFGNEGLMTEFGNEGLMTELGNEGDNRVWERGVMNANFRRPKRSHSYYSRAAGPWK
jgi:hypothetical protein